MHRRQLIREKIKDILINNTDAGDFVQANFTPPLDIEDLPAVLIYPKSENLRELTIAPRQMIRELTLFVECVAAETSDDELSNNLDTLSHQVEQLLSQDDSLDCLVEDIVLTQVEFDFVDEGSKPTGSCRLIYNITYLTNFPEERAPEPELEGFDVGWNTDQTNKTPSGEEIIEARDKIDFES